MRGACDVQRPEHAIDQSRVFGESLDLGCHDRQNDSAAATCTRRDGSKVIERGEEFVSGRQDIRFGAIEPDRSFRPRSAVSSGKGLPCRHGADEGLVVRAAGHPVRGGKKLGIRRLPLGLGRAGQTTHPRLLGRPGRGLWAIGKLADGASGLCSLARRSPALAAVYYRRGIYDFRQGDWQAAALDLLLAKHFAAITRAGWPEYAMMDETLGQENVVKRAWGPAACALRTGLALGADRALAPLPTRLGRTVLRANQTIIAVRARLLLVRLEKLEQSHPVHKAAAVAIASFANTSSPFQACSRAGNGAKRG